MSLVYQCKNKVLNSTNNATIIATTPSTMAVSRAIRLTKKRTRSFPVDLSLSVRRNNDDTRSSIKLRKSSTSFILFCKLRDDARQLGSHISL